MGSNKLSQQPKSHYTVAIIMSTYNGRDYLLPQLNSLFTQEGVNVHLYVRDDASSDDTVRVLKDYAKRLEDDQAIQIFEAGSEGNVGVYQSWNLILEQIPHEYDYYAMCDQDDVWLSDKLLIGCQSMQDVNGPCVFTSNTTAVDKDLNILREYHFENRPRTLRSQFVRYSIPAHVIMFNSALRALVDRFDAVDVDLITSLEFRIILSNLACGGMWIHKPESHVFWRRGTGHNMTVFGRGFLARLKFEWRLFWKRGEKTGWATALTHTFSRSKPGLDGDSREFLERIIACNAGGGGVCQRAFV